MTTRVKIKVLNVEKYWSQTLHIEIKKASMASAICDNFNCTRFSGETFLFHIHYLRATRVVHYSVLVWNPISMIKQSIQSFYLPHRVNSICFLFSLPSSILFLS